MRTLISAVAVMCLVGAGAHGEYRLSLINRANGLTTVDASSGTFIIDLMLQTDGIPAASSGYTYRYLGAQTALAPLPTGWSVSGLSYNTVDFEPSQILGISLAGPIGIGADIGHYGGAGLTAMKRLLSFTLVATSPGTVQLDNNETYVWDDVFNVLYVAPGDVTTAPFSLVPEPATLVLLALGGMAVMKRGRRRF